LKSEPANQLAGSIPLEAIPLAQVVPPLP